MRLLLAIVIAAAQVLGLGTKIPANIKGASQTRTQVINSSEGTPLPVYAPNLVPTRTANAPLNMGSSTVLAVDAQSMQLLYASNTTAPRPIASITKLATALVILSRHDASELVTVPTLPVYASDDAIMGLQRGQVFTVGALMSAMLIESADDAADTFAIWDSGTTAQFAVRMNQMMATWQISGAHFSNPSGLIDQDNYASATALTRLAKLALVNPTIKRIVALPQATISDVSGRIYVSRTTDILLANSAYHGIKTGYTAAAGGCFVGLVTVNGHDVITVVLNSDNRFGDTARLVSWIGSNWQWQ